MVRSRSHTGCETTRSPRISGNERRRLGLRAASARREYRPACADRRIVGQWYLAEIIDLWIAHMADIPSDLTYLLTTNVPAHVTLSRADGSLVTHVMWVDFDGEHVLTSSPKDSYKSRALRVRPHVAIPSSIPQTRGAACPSADASRISTTTRNSCSSTGCRNAMLARRMRGPRHGRSSSSRRTRCAPFAVAADGDPAASEPRP